MKTSVLDLLCCPDCRSEELHAVAAEIDESGVRPEIVEGHISCGRCGSEFPIIHGVLRMLPAALRPSLVPFHRDFFSRYPQLLPREDGRPPRNEVVQTLAGFSYQHLKINDRQQELERWQKSFLGSIPVTREFFNGKIGADLGCGEGRHAYWAHEFGAEVIGVDLSEGVEVACGNTAGCPRCHIVQADIYHLPIRNSVLDFAYSLGVLHHLADPHEGFRRIVAVLKQDGRMFIWVYGLRGMRLWYRISHMTWLRRLTPRLPRALQHALSILIALILELTIWLPCRALGLLPGGRSVVTSIPLGDAYRRSFLAKVRSVFDRIQPPVTHYHDAQELSLWFRDAGFSDVSVQDRDGRGWIATGIKR